MHIAVDPVTLIASLSHGLTDALTQSCLTFVLVPVIAPDSAFTGAEGKSRDSGVTLDLDLDLYLKFGLVSYPNDYL